jgi:hypothetical protein
MPDPTAALQAFERALEDLITVLEDDSTPPEAIERSAERCARAFDDVQAREPDLAGADAKALRRGRERIASLHALARQATDRAARSTERRVTQARDARRALANLRGRPTGGDACDLEC